MVKIVKVKPIMTEERAEEFLGELLGDKDYNILINYDADVYCEETGMLLAKFRKGVIPREMIVTSYDAFNEAAIPTSNRGISAGKNDTGVTGHFRTLKDGTVSKTRVAAPVNSGIIGFYDRTMRAPYCRMTAYTAQKFKKFKLCYPIIDFISKQYKELIPEKWELQNSYIQKTNRDFIIGDTVFTTVTVNKNWQTAVHTDKGDLKDAFGNLAVMRKGKYLGGYFVLVKWGVAIDMQNQDLLFTDVHQAHGNTPIKKLTEDASRISLVMYYRENMIDCGSAEEEMFIAKNRTSLKGLNPNKIKK